MIASSQDNHIVVEEEWRVVSEFPNYEISSLGNIYNHKYNKMMAVSCTNFGHVKISLKCDRTGRRYTRSVAQLVAEAFVRPPSLLCDQVVILDGNLQNVAAMNLRWRPRWFAWKYTRQLRVPQPLYYQNLPVYNLKDRVEYESVIEAGMSEGLLFDDIWKSTYTGNAVFPEGSTFEVVKRV